MEDAGGVRLGIQSALGSISDVVVLLTPLLLLLSSAVVSSPDILCRLFFYFMWQFLWLKFRKREIMLWHTQKTSENNIKILISAASFIEIRTIPGLSRSLLCFGWSYRHRLQSSPAWVAECDSDPCHVTSWHMSSWHHDTTWHLMPRHTGHQTSETHKLSFIRSLGPK